MHSPLAKAIREARRAVRLTQEQLGRQLGLKGRAVHRWECAASIPRRNLRPLLIRAVQIRSEPAAAKLSAAFESHVARTKGLVPSPAPAAPTKPPDSVALELAIFAAADELDRAPRRVRAAMLRLFVRVAEAGYSLDAARRELALRGVAQDSSGTDGVVSGRARAVLSVALDQSPPAGRTAMSE